MKSLATAVYDKLAQLHGAAEVYHGFAKDATMPYISFTLGPSMRRQYAGNSGVFDVLFVVPVTVHVFDDDDTYVGDKVEDIVETFEHGLEVGRHFCVRVDTVSHGYELDPDQDTPGQNIWHGICNFEVTLSRNARESSSSASSTASSASTASTASASSASASSASTASTASTGSSASASSASTGPSSGSSASESSTPG
jgi:hypothetical protein